jgi:hypothetical protein
MQVCCYATINHGETLLRQGTVRLELQFRRPLMGPDELIFLAAIGTVALILIVTA